MNNEIRVVEDVPQAFSALLTDEHPRSFAISGGGTARKCYRLCAVPGVLDWSDTTIYVSDERFVPVNHPDSNEGMARRELFDHVPHGPIHSMRGGADSPEAAAKEYDELISAVDRIDVIHLGLGADGHTASLFPGDPALKEASRLVVATAKEGHPWPRISFTFPAIAKARTVIVTVSGSEKQWALQQATAGGDVPGARIRAEKVIWLVDRPAAGETTQ